MIARTSDGRVFVFHMEGGPDGVLSKEKAYDYISKLTHISGTDQVLETYKYEGRFGWFSEIARPEGRFLKLVQRNEDHEKIYQLIAPANPGDNAPCPIATINYHIESKSLEEGKSGFTESYDANNNRTDYYYTESHVNEVRCFKQDGAKDTSELLYWGSGENNTNLITTAISNSQGQVVLAKHYTYDVFGNVIKERLYGNLTGQKAFVMLNADGVPYSSNIEFCETKCIYTPDHLCSERIEPNGKKTTYTYKPGTNLITSQIVHLENGKRRFFYEYDEDHIFVKVIEDDGSGVANVLDTSGITFRKYTHIKPRQQQPALGMPEEKSVYFWDPKTNKNSLSQREVFFYSVNHKLIQKEIYDANNEKKKSFNWTYDEKGRCVSETNALGQKTEYVYDANNNLIKQVHPGNLVKEFSYNQMNHLVLEKVADPVTQEIQELHYTYDTQGNCLSQTSYVNSRQTGHTIWKYDHKNRIILQGASGLIDHEGQDIWCYEHYEYDVLGNKTLTAAPNNSCPERSIESPITQASYTIRNSPMHIIYPDKSEESFTYYLDGNLHTHTKTDGTKLTYTYDLLGNVIHTAEVSAKGKTLSNSYATYDALGRLVTKKDACGHTTCFAYDTFGRLSTESTEGRDGHIAYSYDGLGREIAKAYYEKGELKHKEEVVYDLLDRPICRELKDSGGAVQEKEEVIYDVFGNIKEKRNYGAQGVEKSLFTYDGFGRLCESMNPMGDKVKITYSLVNLNRWNFWTLCRETIDPLGRKTKELYNTHGSVREVFIYDKEGLLIDHTSKIYDSRDNLTYEQQKDPVSGEVLFEVAFSYNLADQIILQVEGYGHPEAKKTHYLYNAYSQLIKQINPKVALFYEYIKDGQVSRLYTEDGTLDYYYHYDPLGQLVLAEDPEGVCLSREYDALGNLIKDAYSDIELAYSYSPLGRREKVHLPDGSKISYKYRGAYLIASEYKGETAEITQRDLSGRILSLELPFSQGKIHKELDLCGRISSLKAPYFFENLFYDKAGRLIKKVSTTPFGPEEVAYSYDDLDQLISEGNETYKYDGCHNRIEDSQKLFVHTALNQLQSVKGQEKNLELKYDSNGNVIQKLGDKDFHYVYDALDRLIEISSPGHRHTFTYDALSRRVSETYNGEKRTFIYEEMDELGAIANKEIIELRVPIEGIEAEIANSHHFIFAKESYVPIYDHRGNVALLLSSYYKTPSMAYKYTGFGEIEVLDVEKAESLIGYFYTERENACPWLFSSKRCIKETGLTAFGFRDYDASLGKWMSPDPAGFVDGLNLYAYVRNNPLTNYDAYGLWSGVGDTGFDDFSREVIGNISSDPNIQDALSRMPSYQDMHEENKRVIRSTEQFAVGAVDGIVTRAAETGLDVAIFAGNMLRYPIDTTGATITGINEMFTKGWNTFSHPMDTLNRMQETISTLNARELGNATGGLAFDAYATYSGAKLGFSIAKAGCRSAARIGGSMSSVSVIRASRMAMGTKRIPGKFDPDFLATGPHTVWRKGNSGKIEHYLTYEKNIVTGKFVEAKRFRGVGAPHGKLNPPIIYERPRGGGPGARLTKCKKPEKWELPSGY